MIIAKRPTWTRFLTVISGPVFAASGVYLLYVAFAGDSFLLGAGGLIVLLMGILSPILAWRYRLVITDREITAVGGKTRSIEFEDIRNVEMRFGKLILSSATERITVTTDTTNRDEILNFIAAKLASRTDLKYEGDEDDLVRYFGHKSAD